MSDYERELGWDEQITEEGSEYILLPEGDYNFTVKSFERGRHNGSEKMPACNKAILQIAVDDGNGNSGMISHTLFLHSRSERSLGNFFLSVGLKKKGEPLKMNWNFVPGTKGRCHINHRDHNGNKYNNIKYFIIPEDKPTPSFTSGTF